MKQSFKTIQDKVQNWTQAKQTIEQWKMEGNVIVFTNGCFDILHYGHIHYLSEASLLGDKLVIGLNSKDSISRLKGKNRPINDDLTRQHLLAALGYVDLVVEFTTDTPLELITLLLPNILVKGGDWQPKDIVGSDVVMANGGQVLSLPYVQGYSTTNIEQKIIDNYKKSVGSK